jgi:hypothetical protein
MSFASDWLELYVAIVLTVLLIMGVVLIARSYR